MKRVLAALLLMVMCAALLSSAMAEEPAYATTRSLIDTLNENGLAFEFAGKADTGDEHVSLQNGIDNLEYTFHCFFNENEAMATVSVLNIIAYDEAASADVLRAVNSLNSSYKYVRFYVEEAEHTVACAMTIILHDDGDAGDVVLDGLFRAANILRSAYPRLAPYHR